MIGKDRDGELVAVCEECGADAFGGTLEFKEFWEQLKASGWRATKSGDEWEHTCPECVEDGR